MIQFDIMRKYQKIKIKKIYFYLFEIFIITILSFGIIFYFVYKEVNKTKSVIPYLKINNEYVINNDSYNCKIGKNCYSISVNTNDIIQFESNLQLTGSSIKNSINIINNNNFAYNVSSMDKKFYFTGKDFTYIFYNLGSI